MNKAYYKKIFSCLFVILIIGSLALAAELNRPPEWAPPIQLPGVANLYKINDNLHRSAQPTAMGMKNLEEMGIKTIINLSALHSDTSELKRARLLYEELSVKSWHIEDEDVIRVLRIIRKKENEPLLIHCEHGADRTGVMIAMYRIVEQGWSKDKAIKEMVQSVHGFHPVWINIINYIKNVDIKKLKRALEK